MAMDPELKRRLELADPGEPIAIAFILNPEVVASGLAPGVSMDSMEKRVAFAKIAKQLVSEVIQSAATRSGMSGSEITVFDHMAAASMLAPAAMVKFVAEHPSVAAVELVSAQ